MKKRLLFNVSLLISFLSIPFMMGCERQDNSYRVVDLYAFNDVHGRINEKQISYYHYEPGLARSQTYLKSLKENSSNFILLNAGDMYQDTYDSAMNYGKLMAETLPLMGTEAMAIGNHEFDWGIDKLIETKQLAGNTTYLAANVYHYDHVTSAATSFASELGEKYKIIERDGLKIGVIGVIGKEQITSILSTNVDDYIFLEPTQIIKDLSDELRVDKKCDAVILVAHADRSQLDKQSGYSFTSEITSISNVSKRRYVDGVFTGHSHKNQNETFNDVPFIQSGAHGEQLSHIQLKLNHDEVQFLGSETLKIPKGLEPDPTIQGVIDKYLTNEFYEKKNKVIGKLSDGTYLDRDQSGRMLSWMTYENLMVNPDLPVDHIDLVFNNGGRSDVKLPNGDITRGLIFDALPFTNKTYIAEIKGSDIIKEVFQYEFPYYAPREIKIDYNTKYTVAVIDYLLFHKDSDKRFNYFKSFNGNALFCEEMLAVDLIENYLTNIAPSNTISLCDINDKIEYQNALR